MKILDHALIIIAIVLWVIACYLTRGPDEQPAKIIPPPPIGVTERPQAPY